jgi:ABC-type nickel/cobalt efflux system permease component RcnA
MMMGVATTLPLVTAALVGGVFAAASTLTPVLLMVLLSGVLSGKIAKEIPQQLQWFRLASYVLLTLFSAGALINLI